MKSQLEYGGKTLRFEVALPSASCIFGRVLSSFWGKNLSQSPVHAHCPMHLAGSKEISATSVRKFYNSISFYPKTLLIINSSNSLVSVQCLRRSWTHLSRPNSDQIAGIPSSSSSPYHDHHWPGTNGPHSSAVLASSARFHLAGRWWMARGRWPPGSSIYDMISLRSSHKWIRSVTAKILIRSFEKVLKTGLTGLTETETRLLKSFKTETGTRLLKKVLKLRPNWLTPRTQLQFLLESYIHSQET